MPECRFTSTALGALRLAQENAARLGHSYVGSEHLLLGLASQEYSAAARSLQSSGVDSRSLRSAISQLVGTGVPARSLHQGLTPKCCLAIQQAAAASRRLGQNAVSAEHLLLGLLQDRECAACRLMAMPASAAAPAPTAALWVRFLRAIPSMSSARMPASTAALALTPALWVPFPRADWQQKNSAGVCGAVFLCSKGPEKQETV